MSHADDARSMSQGEPPRQERVTSPGGEEFELVGRAEPIVLEPAPYILAEASGDLLVLKEGRLFASSHKDGDMHPGLVTGEGLYADDTRYLSELRLRIGDAQPVLLSSSARLPHKAYVDAANPDLRDGEALSVPQLTLNIHRVRLLEEQLHEHIEICNNGRRAAHTTLELFLAADFVDIFEVRGMRHRMSRGQALSPKRTPEGVRFAYVGEDDVFRETDVRMDPFPQDLHVQQHRAVAHWRLELQPRQRMSIDVGIAPSAEGREWRRRSFQEADAAVERAATDWEGSCTAIAADSRLFRRFMQASARDLRALMTPMHGGEIMTAGIPWFVAPFGRDSVLACYEMLMLTQGPSRETLLSLARQQATCDDAARDAEPGKILHELRAGELAGAGYVPHTPYFGSADSTPLFLMLAGAYYRWTADLDLMAQLRPSFDAALAWIDNHGDQDGDGFVEYHRRSPGGLQNQGWKDSGDAIVHSDGTLAQGPIALVEVQGYVYLARLRMAQVYEALGLSEVAEKLVRQATRLRESFNEAFWMPDEGTFALALDGDKQQVRSVTSNPGHCLYCEIVDADKGAKVAERIMAPDMFSGWGIRTLSDESPAYNPMSYHNGSVWPHDNAIIAAGMKRYGFANATDLIATALFDAAVDSSDARLPELYCGFPQRANVPVVAYPVACRPQAWAAAAPFMLLQAILGISPDAPNGVMTINRPALPSWLRRIDLKGMNVGESQLSLAFTRRSGEPTAFTLLDKRGDIQLRIQE